MLLLRSLLFALGMWLTTPVFAIIGLLTFPFSFSVRYSFYTQWSRINLWWLAVTCRLRYEVEGKENIPDANAIIFCKHQSTWETLALQRVFPPQIWLLKRELLWVPFFGWGLAMLEPIAIDRKAARKALKQLVEQGIDRLKKGRWVVIFPEGTRMAPGKKGKYAPGGAMLAERSGYPVVPVAHNAGEFWRRKGFLKYPGTIKMCIGPAVDTHDKSASEINKAAETWIEAKMEEISGNTR
ncbi:MAG: lysophospholipid acyltransferase family protein [Gammaproteobacteria bacterium]